VLAGRGNAHAADVLAAHLNDRRAAVRRWTVQQFQNTMARINKPLALQRLRAASSSLAHADTRQQVAEAIARLEKP